MVHIPRGFYFAAAIVLAFQTGFLILELVQRLFKIHGKQSKQDSSLRTISYSPNSVGKFDLTAITIKLLAKYTPLGKSASLKPSSDGFDLPLIRIESPLRLTADDGILFDQAVQLKGLPKHEERAHPMFLVSMTTPLLLIILSHPECPIKPLGAVNTRNRFTFIDPAFLSDARGIIKAAKEATLRAKAQMGGPEGRGIRKKRGVEFNVKITVLKDDKPVLVQDCFFLQFLPKSQKPLYQESQDEKAMSEEITSGEAIYQFKVDRKAPRRWAATSKDYNPIHISGIAARLFGFPSIIAHGNLTTALTLASLEQEGSASSQKAYGVGWDKEKANWLEVSFLKPVTPLPIELGTHLSVTQNGDIGFAVMRKEKAYVVGKLGYL